MTGDIQIGVGAAERPAGDLASRFRNFAMSEAQETSPLYHALALGIAEDEALLALAAECRAGQPPANLLLAAVHYLLLNGVEHPLAAWYPNLTANPAPAATAFPPFRDFCLNFEESLRPLLHTRLVQTNELRRSAYLVPALSLVRQLARMPVALIEIGASAGLNLLLDRYAYHYQVPGSQPAELVAGDPHSPVTIDCMVDKGPSVPFPLQLPVIASRTGIDLHPVNLRNTGERRWLQALIWPEHAERAQRMEAAAALWKKSPPRMVAGDAGEALGGVLAAIPANVLPVIFHTHVLNQVSPAGREGLEALIQAAAQRRILMRIGNDFGGGTLKSFPLRLRWYTGAGVTERLLAHVDGHGRWMQWQPEEGG